MILEARKVVFFCAHTDDEMICAGTLHRLVKRGAELHVVAFACAASEHDRKGYGLNKDGNESTPESLKEWYKSMQVLGVKSNNSSCLSIQPSSDFQPHRQEICQTIFDYVELEKPDLVFTLSPEDENTAHAIVGVESERVMRGRVPTVVRCQFPWNYGIGRPNLYVSLDEEDLEAKRRVIACYESQKFRYDYDNMLLAYARGDGLSVKTQYAEKFEIVRSVI